MHAVQSITFRAFQSRGQPKQHNRPFTSFMVYSTRIAIRMDVAIYTNTTDQGTTLLALVIGVSALQQHRARFESRFPSQKRPFKIVMNDYSIR